MPSKRLTECFDRKAQTTHNNVRVMDTGGRVGVVVFKEHPIDGQAAIMTPRQTLRVAYWLAQAAYRASMKNRAIRKIK